MFNASWLVLLCCLLIFIQKRHESLRSSTKIDFSSACILLLCTNTCKVAQQRCLVHLQFSINLSGMLFYCVYFFGMQSFLWIGLALNYLLISLSSELSHNFNIYDHHLHLWFMAVSINHWASQGTRIYQTNWADLKVEISMFWGIGMKWAFTFVRCLNWLSAL